MKRLIIGLLMVWSAAVNAQQQWSGWFTITHLYIAGPQNYHVRVFGMPSLPGCTTAPWAYVNQNTAGASGDYIAALMLAYAGGKQVNLYVAPDANGYCSIIELET